MLITVVYIVIALLIRLTRGGFDRDSGKFILTHVFDGVTLAGSVSLLWGILDPRIIVLVGNTTVFLMIAGLAGVGYALFALFPPRR